MWREFTGPDAQSGLQDGRPSAQDAPCGKCGGCRGWNWGPVGRGPPARSQGVLRSWRLPRSCRLRWAWPPWVLVWMLLWGQPCTPSSRTRDKDSFCSPLSLSYSLGSFLPARSPFLASVGKATGKGGESAHLWPLPPPRVGGQSLQTRQCWGALPLSGGLGPGGPCHVALPGAASLWCFGSLQGKRGFLRVQP